MTHSFNKSLPSHCDVLLAAGLCPSWVTSHFLRGPRCSRRAGHPQVAPNQFSKWVKVHLSAPCCCCSAPEEQGKAATGGHGLRATQRALRTQGDASPATMSPQHGTAPGLSTPLCDTCLLSTCCVPRLYFRPQGRSVKKADRTPALVELHLNGGRNEQAKQSNTEENDRSDGQMPLGRPVSANFSS